MRLDEKARARRNALLTKLAERQRGVTVGEAVQKVDVTPSRFSALCKELGFRRQGSKRYATWHKRPVGPRR